VRKWGRGLIVAWVAGLAVLLVLPLLDTTFTRFVPVLQALWGGWFLLALPTLALLAWLRSWPALAVLVAATAAGLLPIVTAGDDAEPAEDGLELTVLAANVEYSQGDPQQVVDAVRRHSADVLVLSEVEQPYLEQLRDLGLAGDLPHGWDHVPARAPAGTTILSALPMAGAPDLADPHAYGFELPLASVDVDGTEVLVRGVHAYPPVPGSPTRWREELAALDEWAESLPDDQLLVMAGDFNAARSHPGFRDLVDDLTIAPGPATRTWRDERWYPTFVGIDHVLARGLVPVASGSFDLDGSDHDAVWARLARAEP